MADEPILKRIEKDMTAAMKARDAETLSTLRMLKSAMMEARTKRAEARDLTTDEEIETVQRYVKKRRETIEELRRVGREETIAREEAEIAVCERYLPAAMPEEELRRYVDEAIARLGASGPRDMGKVMGAVMPLLKGRTDGAAVSRVVKEALGA